jgi:EpsI family protein
MDVRSPQLHISIVIATLMLASMVLAYATKPTTKLVNLEPREKIETLVPMQFGEWHNVPTANIIVADPRVTETLHRIYSETLSRTYVDRRGRRIMLSIAYGADQRDGMQVHYPEVCYPAQGFQVQSTRLGQVITPFGTIKVKQLEMVLSQRHESVTYWTMIGDHLSFGGVDKKLNEMRYGLRGIIPDGLLFRVSSIAHDPETAYRGHEDFISALMLALRPEARHRLAGLREAAQ